ncbi:MAG: LysR family transcriptional regulator [Cyanobacteria bacterium P01_F01_bin.53]
MNWDDLKIFLTVARQGSARAAADRLGIHHSTITRRIEAFESSQKTQLFDRSPTGYTLTAAGQELLQSVARIEDEVNSIERNILGRDADLKGEIRVTMPDVIAANLLMPDLVRFMETYPDITLKVLISYNMFSLTKREADVAIRISNNPPEHLVGRKVARYHIANYASREYLAKYPLPNKTKGAHWIGWDFPVPHAEWISQSQLPQLPARGNFNNALVQLAAVKAGLGIARLACFVGDVEPDLQRIPPGTNTPFQDIWILTHKDLLSTVRIQTFMDFMAEACRQKRDLLEGRGMSAG